MINAAYAPVQFWDGRAASLEEQAAGPIANPIEMNQAHDVSVTKLEADPAYKKDIRAGVRARTHHYRQSRKGARQL